MSVELDTPIQELTGVGPKRSQMFEQAGVRTVEDLLKVLPFRYEDRTTFREISRLKADQEAVLRGQVEKGGRPVAWRKKRMQVFEMKVRDVSGSVAVKFFNQPYLERIFRNGQEVVLFGKPRLDHRGGGLILMNPEYEILQGRSDAGLHSGRIVPIYRRIGQMSTRILRRIVFELLQKLPEMDDPLPDRILERYGYPRRRSAFQQVHFPVLPAGASRESFLGTLQSAKTAAHQRLIFEEFFLFRLGLGMLRAERRDSPKRRRVGVNSTIRGILKSILPFQPTRAQARVLKEIIDDLCSPSVMNRLLQGDVGSGKTMVALQAMIVMVENGYQTVLMAPTEILAEQHYRNLLRCLEHTPYGVAYLSSAVQGRERWRVLKGIHAGQAALIVGTHALIEEGVRFRRLGMVVIDEQHRFGVRQRSRMIEKGESPETLVMTATPIPRSLALTLYGDLDLSVLDEMPPGRKPVETVIRTEKDRSGVYGAIRETVEAGEQVFVVYPLIEESEKLDLHAAARMAGHLQEQIFPHYSVGLLHGRLPPEERDSLMRGVESGAVQILVSTTVIEVGIDIPNATLMVIEHAERFGLSQLHQLRGRIGRGAEAGRCILMTAAASWQPARRRLAILGRTCDGFQIAEKDLEIRGPGEFVGTRQSGMPEFRLGDLVRDREILEEARRQADDFLSSRLPSGDRLSRLPLAGFSKWWRERYRLFQGG